MTNSKCIVFVFENHSRDDKVLQWTFTEDVNQHFRLLILKSMYER